MAAVHSIADIELEKIRRYYAEEIRFACNLRSEALVEAFGTVPRERYLGPGPWMVRGIEADLTGGLARPTPNADVRHVYHNVSVAIDLSRQLFNGQPGTIGSWIDMLALKTGERVLHIGCATGYFTAIMAHVVGPSGHVTAIEIDPVLARRAAENLAAESWVEVKEGDGTGNLPAEVDAIVVNAGVTHPLPVWLDAMRTGGRMVLPLTFVAGQMPSNIGKGLVSLITREPGQYAARFFSAVAIYSCAVARDAGLNDPLRAAMSKMTWAAVRQLRRDPHEPAPACWFHGPDFCLSA